MYPLGKSTEAHVPKAFFVNSLMCRVRNYEEWHEEYAAIFNRMHYAVSLYDLYHRGMVCQGFVVPGAATRIPSKLPRTDFGFNQGLLRIVEPICCLTEPLRHRSHPDAHD
jgi:hypothetical protein